MYTDEKQVLKLGSGLASLLPGGSRTGVNQMTTAAFVSFCVEQSQGGKSEHWSYWLQKFQAGFLEIG